MDMVGFLFYVLSILALDYLLVELFHFDNWMSFSMYWACHFSEKLEDDIAGKSSFPVVLPKLIENGNAVDNSNQHVKPVSVHPMPSTESSLQKLV